MAAARGPVAAMPGDRRATRARTSDFSLLGNLTKTKSANAFDMFWLNFRKFEILKKNNSCFHVFMFSCFHVFFAATPGDGRATRARSCGVRAPVAVCSHRLRCARTGCGVRAPVAICAHRMRCGRTEKFSEMEILKKIIFRKFWPHGQIFGNSKY